MRRFATLAALIAACASLSPAVSAAQSSPSDSGAAAKKSAVQPEQSVTHGTVTVEGKQISYRAVAGTIILKNDEDKFTGSMFYVAYFKDGADPATRPVTFLYNGGPGSSSMWLHMGAFGPRRATTADHSHTAAAPYKLVNNDYSLLDASDLVFVDAMGTGFSRIIGKDRGGVGKNEDFYGVDPDASSFADFITRFLSEYGRWNSPKYLFGESYGTTRSAVLSNDLENGKDVDLNGVILLSEILSYDLSDVDGPQMNPGMDLTYELALPTYAATAWYHHALPNRPAELEPFLKEVESFAMGPYQQALDQGAGLDSATLRSVAEKMHQYIGLPVDYLMKADLRVNGGEFTKNLLGQDEETTGRLDTRFTGPTIDPLSQEAAYDPQASAISSAYVSLFNDYVRTTLDFGKGKSYRPEIGLYAKGWSFKHRAPGSRFGSNGATNVMLDLAQAMKTNPHLQVLLNSGYFDLATPFYAAVYTMKHLPMERRLQDNISYDFYQSGHMVYAHIPALKELHDNVAKFIESTDNVGG
jgi:carboxypeptidase C (cathepsin A)